MMSKGADVTMTETLILVMSVLLGYLLVNKNIKAISAYIAAYIAALLVGAVISWAASPFMTITVITTTDQLISAAIMDLVGMIAGAFVSLLSSRIEKAIT